MYDKKLLYLFIFWFCISCGKDDTIQQVIPAELLNTEIATEVKITYSDSANIKVIINSPLLYRHTDIRRVENEFPEGVEVHFLDPTQKVQSILTSDYALHKTSEEKIYIRKNVVWKSMDGNQLQSEELIWDQRQKKITSNKPVEIQTPEDNYLGIGFEADQDFKNWRIIKPIGKLTVQELEKSTLKN